MRRDFIDLIAEEKAKGTTVFMSSHMFEEVEECCDRVAFIRDGSIMDIKRTVEIAHNANKLYKAEFSTASDYERFTSQVPASRDAEGTQQTQSGDQPGTKARQLQAQQGALYIEPLRPDQNQAFIRVHDNAINRFMAALGTINVKFITEVKYSLKQYFTKTSTPRKTMFSSTIFKQTLKQNWKLWAISHCPRPRRSLPCLLPYSILN